MGILMALNSCSKMHKNSTATESLRKKFRTDFLIGAAINETQINEKNNLETALIDREFSSISPENVIKSMYVQPTKGNFQFAVTDKFVAFGQKHYMKIHGHTLIWHSQLPSWVAKIKDSSEMKAFIKNHITTLVSRYKGKIDSWDVVNEALNEDGSLRKSVFLEILGETYLEDAFKWAAASDSKTDLYYNDYNLCIPEKREGVVKLVKNLQSKGIKIDGVGIQGHWNLNKPTLEEIEKSIVTYSNLGVKIAITELDISVLPNPWDINGADVNQVSGATEKMNPYPNSLPDSIQDQLAQRYAAIFKLFLKHKDKISRVTFWGVNDSQSWLNDWPIKGRTNYPLLFDRQNQPKTAYKSVLTAK